MSEPVVLEYVPSGQRTGEAEPMGQKCPTGQTAPVTPSDGIEETAPPEQ